MSLRASGAIVQPGFESAASRQGETIMVRASFKWIPLAVAGAVMAASPTAAQQRTPDQTAPQQLAPPVPRSSTELPPPFPHYPKTAPREHDPNYHRPTHKAPHAQSARRGKASHVVKAGHHAKADRHSKADRHAKAAANHKPKRQYFSKRTIRQCHGMTYQQIMAHKNCRTMMQQELADHPSKRPAHHATTQKRKTKHHRR